MIPKLLIALVILYLLYKLVKMVRRGLPGGESKPLRGAGSAIGEDLVEDPYCHTYIPISHACQTSIDGKKVYFCSPQCLERYKAQNGQ